MLGAEAIREEARMDYALRQERKGAKVLKFKTDRRGAGKIMYPAGIFQDWLQGLIRAEEQAGHTTDARKRVEILMKVSGRRFADWLVHPFLSEGVIDYACTRHGGITILDLYPDGPDTVYEKVQTKKTVKATKRCSDPYCKETANWSVRAVKAGKGSGVKVLVTVVEDPKGRSCKTHAERLAQIRADIEQDGIIMSANGGARREESRPRVEGRGLTCCNPNCWKPRGYGARFCEDCIENGFHEGMYE